MCVILAATTKSPTEKVVRKAGERNPDGGGVAWLENGKVRYVKGLDDPKEVWGVVKGLKDLAPFLVHFRIATVGGKVKELTHPFPVTKAVPLTLEGTAPMVLMHNGHWNNWDINLKAAMFAQKSPWPRGGWSDSRAIAWFVAQGGYGAVDFLERLGGGLGGDRVCTLAGDGTMEFWGHWLERDGFWISNDSFESNFTKIGTKGNQNFNRGDDSRGKVHGGAPRDTTSTSNTGSQDARRGVIRFEEASPLPPEGLIDVTGDWRGMLVEASEGRLAATLHELREMKRSV